MGINHYHDSSVAVYSNNGLECFFKEERLTGEKRASHPYNSIQKCLLHSKGPIDYVVMASPKSFITKPSIKLTPFRLVLFRYFIKKCQRIFF